MPVARLRLSCLAGDKLALPLDAPGITGQRSVIAHHPVAGDRNRDIVCRACASGVDLTFATHPTASSLSECQILNSTRKHTFASGPLILTFAKVRAEKGCEC
jgi:hypothetical protein